MKNIGASASVGGTHSTAAAHDIILQPLPRAPEETRFGGRATDYIYEHFLRSDRAMYIRSLLRIPPPKLNPAEADAIRARLKAQDRAEEQALNNVTSSRGDVVREMNKVQEALRDVDIGVTWAGQGAACYLIGRDIFGKKHKGIVATAAFLPLDDPTRIEMLARDRARVDKEKSSAKRHSKKVFTIRDKAHDVNDNLGHTALKAVERFTRRNITYIGAGVMAASLVFEGVEAVSDYFSFITPTNAFLGGLAGAAVYVSSTVGAVITKHIVNGPGTVGSFGTLRKSIHKMMTKPAAVAWHQTENGENPTHGK